MFTADDTAAEFATREPNKHKARSRARRTVTTGLDISRLPHLLRPYIISLNVLQSIIEKNGESSTAPNSSACVEESPIFKYGRSLANKVVRRYGKMKTRSELADPTWNSTSSCPKPPVDPEDELFQYQPAHHQLFASTFDEVTNPLPFHIEEKRRIQNAINAYEGIMRAMEPVNRRLGVRTLAEISSTVVGRGVEDWISDEVMASSLGMPVLKDDGRVLAARDYCYDAIPALSRANVLSEHAISLAANLSDHPIKFRLLGRLAQVCLASDCDNQAWHAVQALIPCPSLLHPGYIHAIVTRLSGWSKPQLFDVITTELLAHMATLNPVECFSESVQTFFKLATGVNQATIMSQVVLCTARLLERRQDEADMWDMLDRWAGFMIRPERTPEELLDVSNIFRPLIARYLVDPRKSDEQLHSVLLSIAISLISPDTIDFLGPIVTRADLQPVLKVVSLSTMPYSRLWEIINTIEGLDMPFLEVALLEALDSHQALSCGLYSVQRDVETRLKDAQRRARDARECMWWDEELGEWVDSSPVKVKTTKWLSSDWDIDAQSVASSGDNSNFSTPVRLPVPSSIARSAWQPPQSEEKEAENDENGKLSAASTPIRSKSGGFSLILDTPSGIPDLSSDPLADDDDDFDVYEAPAVLQALLQPIKPRSPTMKPQANRRVTFSRSLSYSTSIPLSKVTFQPRMMHSATASQNKHQTSVPLLKPILSAKCKVLDRPLSSPNSYSAPPSRMPLGDISRSLLNYGPSLTFTRTTSLPCLAKKGSKLVRSRAESEESEDPLDCFRDIPKPANKRVKT